MSLQKKPEGPRPLEFEVWARVSCPHCYDKKKDKRVFVSAPARGMPDQMRCFNCGGQIPTKNLFKTGKELVGLGAQGEIIKEIIL